MIIGKGDIAKILNDRKEAIFFASGVSNSNETNSNKTNSIKTNSNNSKTNSNITSNFSTDVLQLGDITDLNLNSDSVVAQKEKILDLERQIEIRDSESIDVDSVVQIQSDIIKDKDDIITTKDKQIEELKKTISEIISR